MKIVFKTYFLITLIICLSSCNQKKVKTKSSNEVLFEKTIKTPSKSVSLIVEPKIFELSEIPNSLNLIMTNHTKDTIMAGLRFVIENFRNNEWNEVSPRDLFFDDIGFEINPSSKKEFENSLLTTDIEYEVGRYRIVKHYLKPDFILTKNKNYVYVEFTIE